MNKNQLSLAQVAASNQINKFGLTLGRRRDASFSFKTVARVDLWVVSPHTVCSHSSISDGGVKRSMKRRRS